MPAKRKLGFRHLTVWEWTPLVDANMRQRGAEISRAFRWTSAADRPYFPHCSVALRRMDCSLHAVGWIRAAGRIAAVVLDMMCHALYFLLPGSSWVVCHARCALSFLHPGFKNTLKIFRGPEISPRQRQRRRVASSLSPIVEEATD